MKAICVDDEALILQHVVSRCQQMPELDDVQGFSSAGDALKWLSEHPIDLAILDIGIPDMSGISLAKLIKEKSPDTAIIFLTGYSQFAVDAFSLHASGYLLKPVDDVRLREEVEYALSRRLSPSPAPPAAIWAHTFGSFDLYVNGKPISFERAKAKELLALLVDLHGDSITRAEIFATLYEDAPYDRRAQKQLDVIVRSLKKTLSAYQVEQIWEMKRGNLRIVPTELDCDMYRLLAGDIDAANAYRGEYMNNYSWAMTTEGYLDRRFQK